jgi:hypothetical protein
MSFKNVLTSPEPEPGELLDAFRDEMETNSEPIEERVETLEEQKEVANSKLDFFLSNIADSPGAVKVVEQFYEEEHGKTIDASDVDELRDEVPDIDSILYDNALPKVSKEDLRHHFGVEGVYGVEDDEGNEIPYLTPEWVREHEEEPYRVGQTSGTTGKPWGRAGTRNDFALVLLQFTSSLYYGIRMNNIDPNRTHSVVIVPGGVADPLSKSFSYIGSTVEVANVNKLNTGGENAIEESKRLINHLNNGDRGVVLGAADELLRGKLGVELRRKNINIDLVFNAGKPLAEDTRRILERSSIVIENFFGETEYPQSGGLNIQVDNNSGFNLPFDTQINLVYDTESENLDYEGEGKFAYLPYGLEGQPVPGVYISGVRCKLKRIDDRYQLLTYIGRDTDPNRGCHRN